MAKHRVDCQCQAHTNNNIDSIWQTANTVERTATERASNNHINGNNNDESDNNSSSSNNSNKKGHNVNDDSTDQ